MMRISGAVYGKRTYGSVRAKKTGNYSCFLATRLRNYVTLLLKKEWEYNIILLLLRSG